MASSIYVKQSGTIKQVVFAYVKDAGVWKAPVAIYVKQSGVWKLVYYPSSASGAFGSAAFSEVAFSG
jgi:hypothetical protein